MSVERIEVLAQDGLIGATTRRGELWVSSGDVSDMAAAQQRNKKRCRVMDALMEVDRGQSQGKKSLSGGTEGR